ncbi:hypothetical protein AAC387_Pa04g0801 [Persea americana]
MHSYTSTNSSISLQFPSKLRFQNNSPSKHHHFSTLLQSCNNLPHLKQIHAQLLKSALNLNSPHAARLISFYSSFKSFSYARRVFDTDKEKTIFVWNAIIRAYSMSLLTHQDALHMFVLMLCCCSDDGFVGANEFTYPYLLKCCDSLQEGRQIHAHIFKSFWGLDANVFVCAALIDMYVRCGLLNSDARRVFDKMPERDGVCWNTMISGYSKAGDYEMVLSLFRKMLEDVGVEPTSTTIVNVLSACGEVGALAEGRWIHRFMERKDEMNIFIKTALITMYSKCGDILAARGIFDQCLQRDLVLWSAMMSGYGINGHGLEALKLFRLMEKEGLRPDSVTFVSLISACSHAGLINEGLQLFHSMKKSYGLEPQREHYACMVDLLGRAGQLKEALSLIEHMPMDPGASVWGALLGACRVHRNFHLGEMAAKELFEIEGEKGGNYVLLCNIYEEAGRSANAQRLRRKMKKMRIKKSPGCSCIEVGERVHSFRVAGQRHPQTFGIYEALKGLTLQAFDEGYVFQSASSFFME